MVVTENCLKRLFGLRLCCHNKRCAFCTFHGNIIAQVRQDLLCQFVRNLLGQRHRQNLLPAIEGFFIGTP